MKNNKGFSLVELIIVIAIMAILVGVMAPQLIKYIEKTNVSADTQVADSVKTAITTAIMDPAVINDTRKDGGADNITAMNTAAKDKWAKLADLPGKKDDALTVRGAVVEILGWSDVDVTTQRSIFKSSPAKTKGEIAYTLVQGNTVGVEISQSDITGKKTPKDDASNWIVVGAKAGALGSASEGETEGE